MEIESTKPSHYSIQIKSNQMIANQYGNRTNPSHVFYQWEIKPEFNQMRKVVSKKLKTRANSSKEPFDPWSFVLSGNAVEKPKEKFPFWLSWPQSRRLLTVRHANNATNPALTNTTVTYAYSMCFTSIAPVLRRNWWRFIELPHSNVTFNSIRIDRHQLDH